MKRSTLVTVGVFAILLVVVLLLKGRPVERGSERMSLAGLDVDAIDRLMLVEGESSIELVREGAAWKLAESGHLADPQAIERAIEGLTSIDTSDVVSTAPDKQADYGVDPESGLTVEVSSSSDKVARVVLGDAESGGSYVRGVGKETVFQTARSLRPLFPLETDRWLKLRFFDGALEDARRVEVALVGEPAWAIVPSADEDSNEWQLEDLSLLPEDFRFDGRGARSLASTVVALRAKELVEEAPGETEIGLADEHDRVTLHTESGSVSVHLGAATDEDDVYARVDGREETFLIRSYQATNLRKRIADLRDLRIMAFDPTQTTALEIADGRDAYRFARGEDGSWVIAPDSVQPPEDFEFDSAAVERTVQSVGSLRATALAEGVNAAAAGLERPQATVTVGLGDGGSARLEFGAGLTDDNDRKLNYARGNADDHVYTVGEYHLDRFTRGWESFKFVPPPPAAGNPYGNLDPETLKNLPPEVRESLMKQMIEEQRKQELMRQIQQQQGAANQ